MRNSMFRLIAGLICILSLVLVSTAPAGAQASDQPTETGTLTVLTYVSAQVEEPSLVTTDFDVSAGPGSAVPSDRQLQLYLNENLNSDPFATITTVEGVATIDDVPVGTHYLFDLETQRFFSLTITAGTATAVRVVIPEAMPGAEMEAAAAESETEADPTVAEVADVDVEPPAAEEPLPEVTEAETEAEAEAAAPEDPVQPDDAPEPPVETTDEAAGAEAEAATGEDEVALAPESPGDTDVEAAAPEDAEEADSDAAAPEDAGDDQLSVTQLPSTGIASISGYSQAATDSVIALFVALSVIAAAVAFTWHRRCIT